MVDGKNPFAQPLIQVEGSWGYKRFTGISRTTGGLEMHHGDESQLSGLGPTGNFPQGKLNSNDEGELALGITHDKGKVIIDFGKPVAWIGFDPKQAKEIARMFELHAIQCEIESETNK